MEAYGDKIWDELFSSREWGKYPSEEAIRFFMRSKKILGKDSPEVLDLGCGAGALSWFMAREGGNVTAMDGAPSGLKGVGELAKRMGVKSEIVTILGDITEPEKFVHGSFDIVVDHYSMCHNPKEKIEHAISSLFNLIKPGGFLMSCCFGEKTTGFGNGDCLGGNTYSNVKEGNLENRGVITFFSLEEREKLFTDAGFKPEYFERIIQERQNGVEEKIINCVRKP
jgi:SAM-dependent methyltransferase